MLKLIQTALVLSTLAFSLNGFAQAEKSKATFTGPDFDLTGDYQISQVGAVVFMPGAIIKYKGDVYQIVTSSLYGRVGAVNVKDLRKFLYFTSSYGPLVTNDKLPKVYAQSFDACLNNPYNALAVTYDTNGVDVIDAEGNHLDLTNGIHIRKYLFEALTTISTNSKSSAGGCFTIERQGGQQDEE